MVLQAIPISPFHF
ncbi:hypothetical protein GBAR_LOCUS1355 [Geodia barretti]|uniref:Uncharacterized protein n=1 Tax=Geodia barretti TaxID=519541 RepID=A0AA35W4V5_GEOBA|nr:hypothetical protein GBAR_LOCUS1355 [Geodia barretti]